jgi:N-acetylglucosamine kinase-like BadF-type ATPase
MIDYIDEEYNFKGAIESGIARVCLKANLKFSDIIFASIAIPGYGEDDYADRLMRKLMSDVFHDGNFICENEIESAWMSALGGHEGIVILAGIGSIAMGKNNRGETIRSGGWGRIAGDEGGEYWLARKVLEIYTKSSDGRYERQGLYHRLKEKMNIKKDTNLYNFSFQNLSEYGISFQALVDTLFESFHDDQYAKEVVYACAKEYVLLVESIKKIMSLKEPSIVSYIGRIFDNEILVSLISQDLGGSYKIQIPLLSLVSGSALRAMMFKEKVNLYDVRQLLLEENRINKLK